MVKARKYVVTKLHEGLPKRDDFEIVEYELPALRNGEILIKVEWVSMDPSQRAAQFASTNAQLPYDQPSFQVGLVQDSKAPGYPIGTRVVSHGGWCDYCVIDTNVDNGATDRVRKIKNLKNVSPSLSVGALGMPGASAYFGLLEVCKPKAGEIVVITGAAGAVGSLVGQIAKLKGCKVIGFAGTDEKVKWLEEIGFDKAFNYKTSDITASLKEAAPDGVDIYFDNVGGEMSSLIIDQMRMFGRISVCGSISLYNEDRTKLAKTNVLQPIFLIRQLKMEGWHVYRWTDRWQEAFDDIAKWIVSGELKPREHITEGFENIYDAFVGVLKGENVGKAVVKL